MNRQTDHSLTHSPFMYLVSECIDMSAPQSNGLCTNHNKHTRRHSTARIHSHHIYSLQCFDTARLPVPRCKHQTHRQDRLQYIAPQLASAQCNNNNNNNNTRQLISLLGRRIAQVSGEAREISFLFRRCSVLVQRFNAVLLHDDLPVID